MEKDKVQSYCFFKSSKHTALQVSHVARIMRLTDVFNHLN